MISLCMIVKDESLFLEQCLESVNGLVDEIIVVDTGSKDTTIEIAKKFSDKIFEIDWPNDFSKARNFSLEKASNDWILILDADEVISKSDFSKIKELVKDDVDGYILLQRNYTNDTSHGGFVLNLNKIPESKDYVGYFDSPLVRLFRKGYVFEGKVHEAVEPSIEKANGKIIKTSIAIHHYGFIREDKSKAGYLKLAKDKVKDVSMLDSGVRDIEKLSAKSLFDSGMENMRNLKYKNAIIAFEAAFEKDKYNAQIAYNLAGAYLKNNQNEDAIKILETFLEESRGDFCCNLKWQVDLSCNLAVAYQNTKQFDKALIVLKKALTIDGNNINIVKNLGATYLMMKNYKEAMRYFGVLIKIIPKDSFVHYNLGLCFLGIRNKMLMIEAFKKAIEYNHPRSEELKEIINK